ncbi:TPMT family class I SAM-dependent methyltransferase [Limobrevibacterium gyesilva]|uniref:TPMT family class I SAM-dependent methyltransferase n=1 Tax=Limobrevibacterium gyesilva TaxID=2991712 RepID=A0AA42CJL7_9PROT|nr:TPMT family class I SAM-dependent methyltransferase [Limobrevibacterium gyesilva]MCW3477032.1 TPMT family class I SAM-dependent methyltransferase [Limobrevibacterium gyesilva]
MSPLPVDWEAKYRQGTTFWQRPDSNPALAGWLADGTLRPGRILLPGAGQGAEPLDLAKAGFDVTVVDIAPSAVAFQQGRIGPFGGHVLLADLFAWEPDAPFDAVYDQTCLCALSPALWDAYAARLARWVRPGGVLAVLFMQTNGEGGPPFHCDLGRMRELFPADSWTWPAPLPAPVAHPSGLSEQPAALMRLSA